MSDSHLVISQAQYDRIAAELEERKGPIREEIRIRIGLAREEGDLKENGGYHAAREEQGKNEARIRELQYKLDNATIGIPEVAEGTVGLSHRVTVNFVEDDEEETFILIAREGAVAGETVYSPDSPLGAAVLNAKVGDTVSFTTPRGLEMKVQIISSVPTE